jgi:hypothetical protein
MGSSLKGARWLIRPFIVLFQQRSADEPRYPARVGSPAVGAVETQHGQFAIYAVSRRGSSCTFSRRRHSGKRVE